VNDQDRDRIIDFARRLGVSAGKAAGSWVIDGNTSSSAAARILKGYDEGDPEILDMQPSPLSGEWADGLTVDDVLIEIALYADAGRIIEDERDDAIDVWLDGFSEGYWDEVIRAARHSAEVAA
jgi:hypothetical protein